MPRVPNQNYHILNAWDALVYTISSDTDMITDLKITQINEITKAENIVRLAITTLPLTQETIIFSDANLAMGIWYKTEKQPTLENGVRSDIVTFYQDFAAQNEDLTEVIRMVERLSEDSEYTIELNQNLIGENGQATAARIICGDMNPIGPPDKKAMWTYIARRELTAMLYSQYR